MRYFKILATIVAFVISALAGMADLSAEQIDSVLTVSGIVRDDSSRLPYVSVMIENSTLGTVTNEDGYFSLKIPKTDGDITVVVSHVGYYATRMTLKATSAHDMRIVLRPYPNLLDHATIISYDPEQLVRDALQKIRYNYPTTSILQRGFYRETVQKGNRFISISEAVMDIFKLGYHRSIDSDKVKVVKGRMLVSQKSADTLSVKLQGGPTLPVSLDVVKNRLDLFFEEDLPSYNYSFMESTVIEQRPQFVVRMTPRYVRDDYPLYNSMVYIDKETHSIMRVEYSVDMTNPSLVTTSLLRKKPLGIRFEPLDVSFVVGYRHQGEQTVLNYVRTTMKFKCDWKKKLFSSAYTVVSEMVATDIRMDNVEPIPFRETFRSTEVFYDKVSDFSDPDFWGAYNILEPTESLENAVGRLKRRAR